MNQSYKRFWEPNFFQVHFLGLTVASIATFLSYPFQYVKTIIQFRSQAIGIRHYSGPQWGYNPNKIFRQMHQLGGMYQIFQGFQAALMGRLTHLLVRNTLYKLIYDYYKPPKPTNDLSKYQKMWISGFAGGVAAIVSNPFDKIMIIQICDSQIKPEWRRNYRSTIEGFNNLKNYGKDGLFGGSFVNVLRAIMVNITITYPYDQTKERLWIQFGDHGFVKPVSLLVASTVSAFLTLPFDNIRTRVMQQHFDRKKNRINFKNLIDLGLKIKKYEKGFSLWVGLYAYWCKVTLYAFLTVYITDKVTSGWKRKAYLQQWQIQ